MTNIQSNKAAVREVLSSRNDTKVYQAPAKRLSPDEALMYAWSIGTTRAAQEMPSEHETPRQKEECPPEVYIG